MTREFRVFLCLKADEPGAGSVKPWLEVREAVHDEKGRVSSWDDEPVMMEGRDLASLLRSISQALEEPVRDAETGKELGSYAEVRQRYGMDHA